MKLEYLDKINNSGDNIVRLYDFDCLQADELRKTIQKTVIENKTQLDVATVDFIKPINCGLTFRIADTDKGITTTDAKMFYCDLTLEAYHKMTGLLEPFCHEQNNGHQWLYDVNTPTDLLFSPSGTW